MSRIIVRSETFQTTLVYFYNMLLIIQLIIIFIFIFNVIYTDLYRAPF